MKEQIKFTVSVGNEYKPDWQAKAKSILEPMNPIHMNLSPSGLVLEFVFDHYPDLADEARHDLRGHGISSSISVRREYTMDELVNAKFLVLNTREVVDSVPDTLQWHLLRLCDHCGFQETVWDLSTLHIANKPQGYEFAKVDWHPKVVSPLLAEQLQKEKYTGLELIPIHGENLPSWYAVQTTHTLPPLKSPPTRLIRLPRATTSCQPNHNWEFPDSQFFYNRAGFEVADFNKTFEIFGDSQSAAPAIVISNRVYRMFTSLGVKKLICEPIQIIE